MAIERDVMSNPSATPKKLRQRSLALLLTALTLVLGGLISAPAASADGSYCASSQCLTVYGVGLHVSSTKTYATNAQYYYCDSRAKNWFGGSNFGVPYVERWGGTISGCGTNRTHWITWNYTFATQGPLFADVWSSGRWSGNTGVNLWV
ncbi:hypothetical protein SAMN04489743_1105 [Pseudarthrobacter equi]|uniref:Uncharacterized protein n=1 Tax=Pseudarthrobacter equi TaxID=728066 RepID=A0A1H1VV70_9MICC|nr:hypothetical protein SAMN04489743_1105 [Pseudarthrobacter equi]